MSIAIFHCLLTPGSYRENFRPSVSRSVTLGWRNRNLCCSIAAAAPKEVLCVDSKVKSLLDSVKWDDMGLVVAIAQNVDTGAILMQGFANSEALETTISSSKATFYSRSREEADELARTLLDDEDGSHTASEMGDLLYHAMVLLKLKDVKMEDVLEVLRNRFSQSGIEEKSSRSS